MEQKNASRVSGYEECQKKIYNLIYGIAALSSVFSMLFLCLRSSHHSNYVFATAVLDSLIEFLKCHEK